MLCKHHSPPYPGIRVRGFLGFWRFFEVFLNIPACHKRWGLENSFVGTNSPRRIHPYTAEAPEDIPNAKSGHPKLVFSSWPWAAGNIRFFSQTFILFFRKSRPPIGPLEFRPRAKSYFRWSSTYHLSKRNIGLKTCFFLIFRFQDNKKFRTSENNKRNSFSF